MSIFPAQFKWKCHLSEQLNVKYLKIFGTKKKRNYCRMKIQRGKTQRGKYLSSELTRLYQMR